MRMDDQEESANVEDVRGSGGGGFQFRPVHGVGLGTVALALIGGWIFGINPLQVLSLLSGGGSELQGAPAQPAAPPPAGDAQARFVRRCCAAPRWSGGDLFSQAGRSYEEPRLRLYRDSYPTACGQGQAAAGPFYCSQDRIVYLDWASST